MAAGARTSESVRQGGMSRRAPLSGQDDEFDRLAANINAMLAAIETLTEKLRNVSVGLAHDLRTPLARVRNRLASLDRSVDEEEREQAVADALADLDRTRATFDALLKIGRIEAQAGRRSFALELVDAPAGRRLRVSDDGPGIAAADRDRVFERPGTCIRISIQRGDAVPKPPLLRYSVPHSIYAGNHALFAPFRHCLNAIECETP